MSAFGTAREEEIEFHFEPHEFDPYQTLNVTPDATIEEIQESYKRLSKTFHPDRNAEIQDINTANALRHKFDSITKAKEILCDTQVRKAYDSFGLKGVQMMKQEMFKDLQSMQIGKQYRTDDAVVHLLKYYLKREATIELDKLVSSYGHCEIGIDATGLYEEFVDLIFRHETLPQFIHNIWNGIPTLQIVVNEQPPMYPAAGDEEYEPVHVVDDDYDFDAEELELEQLEQQQAELGHDIDDFIQAEEEEDVGGGPDLSMSELMNKSVEEQVAIIQEALNSGNMTALRGIPVQRQSVRPKLSSFLVSLGYQYEYDDNNTVVLSSTQYLDDLHNTQMHGNKLYHSMNIEWHRQMNRYTKLVSVFSAGLSTLSSRFTLSRNIDARTNIDIGLYFNFMDVFWKTFTNLFSNNYLQPEEENAADLFDNIFADTSAARNVGGNGDANEDGKPNKAYWRLLPEILTVLKNTCLAMYNFVVNSKDVIQQNMSAADGNNAVSWYPGFDLSFGVRRLLFNEWMGITQIRLGRQPSFSWSMLKQIGLRHWNIGMDIGRNSIGLSLKHEKSLDKTVRFYIALAFDVMNIIKFECGLKKLFIDEDLQEMIDEFTKRRNKQSSDLMASNIDISSSFGIEISLRQGISSKFTLKRGVSAFNVPIKLTESPANLKHILLSLAIPMVTYFGYKWYYKPYSQRRYHEKITSTLNEQGLSLFNKRQLALKQQSIMMKQAIQSHKLQSAKDDGGLVILCAFYGENVEKKVFTALRKILDLDKDDEEEEEEEEQEDADNEPDVQTDEEHEDDEKYENEEEKQTNDGSSPTATDDGRPNPPPLFFDIYNRHSSQQRKENKKKQKKNKKSEDERYRVRLCDVDWIAMERELETVMKHGEEQQDIHLLPFLNVRLVLQYMVRNIDATASGLQLASGDKSCLPGFYDCCPDHDLTKQLFVVYQYKDGDRTKPEEQFKYVTISNLFPLSLPNDSHLSWVNCRWSA